MHQLISIQQQQQIIADALAPETYEKVFLPTGLVDANKTSQEGGNPLLKVFFNNPYGLQYRPDHKNWIPFRHGELKL